MTKLDLTKLDERPDAPWSVYGCGTGPRGTVHLERSVPDPAANTLNGKRDERAVVEVFPLLAELREAREALRRAHEFIRNVPTDAQLDARMQSGDTGRAVWGALATILSHPDAGPHS